jgi:hypothetical protein
MAPSNTGADKGAVTADPGSSVIPPSKRRAAMRGLDAMEIKWSKAGLALGAVFSIFLPVYAKTILHSHADKTKDSTTLALELGGVALVFTIFGFVGLLRRRRTVLAFGLFIVGFSFTLTFAPLGFAFILLGGWLLLRAYRIQKYGTPNAKQAAREAATRPRTTRAQRQEARAPVKGKATNAVKKPPTASKRYTPKAAPRKRVAKPTE